MSKIKKLAKSIEDVILETPWIYKATTNLHNYLTKVLKAKELYYLRSEINGEIDAWDIAEVSEKQKTIVRNIMNTVLHSLVESETASTGKTSFKRLVRLNLTVAKAIASRLSNIVSVQPMKTPVSLLYSLQHNGGEKQEDGTNSKPTLELVSQAVEAGSRRLQTGWSLEAAQDLKAIHNLDIEAEVLKIVGNEIAGDITHELLSDLMRLGKEVDIREMGLVKRAYDDVEVGKLLVLEIQRAASDIGRGTCRGSGNFAVVSPFVLAMLQVLPEDWFTPAPTLNGSFLDNLLLYVGDIGSMKIFMSMQVGDNILVGYKHEASNTDAGFHFAPYIPVASIGVHVDPETWQPVMNLITRYGKALTKDHDTAQEYYRVLKLDSAEPENRVI